MSVAIVVLLTACSGSDSDVAPHTADTGPGSCPPDSLVTWETFGQGFIDTWCTTCHSEILVGDARYGAPAGVDFNSYEAVLPYAEAIRTQAAGDDPVPMPPSGGTTETERLLLVEWLDCGLPER